MKKPKAKREQTFLLTLTSPELVALKVALDMATEEAERLEDEDFTKVLTSVFNKVWRIK